MLTDRSGHLWHNLGLRRNREQMQMHHLWRGVDPPDHRQAAQRAKLGSTRPGSLPNVVGLSLRP